MIILGIDPAIGKLGWGVIKVAHPSLIYLASGLITSQTQLLYMRLAHIVSQVDSIICEYSPTIVAIEETFVNTNAISSLKLGYIRGALMALVGKHNLQLQEFKPNTIKKTVTGSGHADKQQVLHMIKLLLRGVTHNITELDAADALAVAYTCAMYLNNKSK